MAAQEVNAQPAKGPAELTSVWHYTTAEGLRSIITSGVLWATSHRFMNDSEEPKYAAKALRAAADHVRHEVRAKDRDRFEQLLGYAERRKLEAFLLCAALDADLLTVWRGYGDAVPYAIELDATASLLPVAQSGADAHPSPPRDWGRRELFRLTDGVPVLSLSPDRVEIDTRRWAAVHYNDAVAVQRVQEVARLAKRRPDALTEGVAINRAVGRIDLLQLKHPAFVDEREARMVFEVNPRWKFVKHRATRFGLTPFIEVSAVDDGNDEQRELGYVTAPAARLPIKSVHIGPSPLGEESEAALREFLEFNGYPDVEVSKSKTPFR